MLSRHAVAASGCILFGTDFGAPSYPQVTTPTADFRHFSCGQTVDKTVEWLWRITRL
ncbi:protein of unknown function [Agreia sp. COWG]|nr:protein of unknown function [Agreia sp. COWG]